MEGNEASQAANDLGMSLLHANGSAMSVSSVMNIATLPKPPPSVQTPSRNASNGTVSIDETDVAKKSSVEIVVSEA